MRRNSVLPGTLLGMLCLSFFLVPLSGQERKKKNLLIMMTDPPDAHYGMTDEELKEREII